jgi:hypothetical protein
VLGQQVFFSQRDNDAGPATVTSMDAWDGYVASRERITRGWVDARVRNPVVLTGDVHAHWASEIEADFREPTGTSVGTELVCSSITSGGDGADEPTGTHPWFGHNPHLKFWNNLRGYVNTTITPRQLDADFRCVPRVTTPGLPAFTRRSYTIADGDRTLHQTADAPSTTRTLRQGGLTPRRGRAAHGRAGDRWLSRRRRSTRLTSGRRPGSGDGRRTPGAAAGRAGRRCPRPRRSPPAAPPGRCRRPGRRGRHARR